jgi:hypothetical protein
MMTGKDEIVQVPLSRMLEGTRAHLFHVWRYWDSNINEKKTTLKSLNTLQESILSGYLKSDDSNAVIDFLTSPLFSNCVPPVYNCPASYGIY